MNQGIRTAAKQAHVHLWEIADALGLSDSAFSRRLRKELPQEDQQTIFEIIDRLERRSDAQ